MSAEALTFIPLISDSIFSVERNRIARAKAEREVVAQQQLASLRERDTLKSHRRRLGKQRTRYANTGFTTGGSLLDIYADQAQGYLEELEALQAQNAKRIADARSGLSQRDLALTKSYADFIGDSLLEAGKLAQTSQK